MHQPAPGIASPVSAKPSGPQVEFVTDTRREARKIIVLRVNHVFTPTSGCRSSAPLKPC
ncbi:MAG: hypothetical protein WCG50_17625 [Rhodoferax sp.]|uniref:hypothetical protein n=1 Tax=Rhodoferax sp. TaxID=50421 RepID=UPI00301A66C2